MATPFTQGATLRGAMRQDGRPGTPTIARDRPLAARRAPGIAIPRPGPFGPVASDPCGVDNRVPAARGTAHTPRSWTNRNSGTGRPPFRRSSRPLTGRSSPCSTRGDARPARHRVHSTLRNHWGDSGNRSPPGRSVARNVPRPPPRTRKGGDHDQSPGFVRIGSGSSPTGPGNCAPIGLHRRPGERGRIVVVAPRPLDERSARLRRLPAPSTPARTTAPPLVTASPTAPRSMDSERGGRTGGTVDEHAESAGKPPQERYFSAAGRHPRRENRPPLALMVASTMNTHRAGATGRAPPTRPAVTRTSRAISSLVELRCGP